MAITLSGTISASASSSRLLLNNNYRPKKAQSLRFFSLKVRASSTDDSEDCNTEECAPDKEVGTVSMEWLAGEKTKVVGTFPPRNKRGWTGYVEKDTAGQTNIYSVEPAVYIAESAISSGTAGSSADGAENTAAVVAGLALIAIAAASSILLQVGKNPPPVVQTADYSGPSLSYYINKFKPPEIIEVTEIPKTLESESSVSPQTEIQVESQSSETESSVSPQTEVVQVETPQVS